MRILYFLIFFLSWHLLSAQVTKFGLPKDDSSHVNILVEAPEEIIHEIVLANGGIIKYRSGSITSCRGPLSMMEELLKHEMVTRIQFMNYAGQPLNDIMLQNNNVDSAHSGLGFLPGGFSGNGVLIGIIDSGIDPDHPDFKDSLGNTRIREIWDQMAPYNSIRTPVYGYGQVWNDGDINGGLNPHHDNPANFGHGTNVSGTAAGNGRAVNNFTGVAPKSELVVVASNFNAPNWTATVVDAVHYIFSLADSLQMPCVINTSIGTYLGSHDGTDLAAVAIDSMILAKPGRSLVAAAGNAGNQFYHLGYDVTSDTTFTWFKHNPSSFLGYGAVYFDLWADTAQFNQVGFSFGADQEVPYFSHRGSTPFFFIQNRINQLVTDTLFSLTGHIIGIIDTWVAVDGGKYLMQVHIQQPDSNQYNFRFSTTGTGRFDVWSASWLGTSSMVYGPLPFSGTFPDIVHYRKPDTLQTIVSSWTCSPHVITVGNYINRADYIDYNGNLQTFPVTEGEIAASSSLGPTRGGEAKPDVAASGDYTLSAGRLPTLQSLKINEPWKVAPGGMHNRNGGTSMASPVVAGIVALLFENCPNATATDISYLISQNTKHDTYTGTMPDDSWGNGKVDASAALRATFFQPGLVPFGQQILCTGDSVNASVDPAANYFWSNGDTASATFFHQNGVYTVYTENSMGCKSFIDSLTIITVPLPDTPAIYLIEDTLYTDSAFSYQWYFNDQPLTGATGIYHETNQTGYYFVLVTDSNGCSAKSQVIYHEPVSVEEFSENDILLYPNPGVGSFTLFLPKNSGALVSVKDISGKVIFSDYFSGNSSKELAGINPGSYFVEIRTSTNTFVKKWICL